MTHIGSSRNMLSFILKSLLVVLLLFSVFSVVYLRSSVRKLEYNLADLEKKKMNYLKERKILFAEKTSLLSFEKVGASLSEDQGFVLPDRIRVIHVKKQKGVLPYKVALERKQMVEP